MIISRVISQNGRVALICVAGARLLMTRAPLEPRRHDLINVEQRILLPS